MKNAYKVLPFVGSALLLIGAGCTPEPAVVTPAPTPSVNVSVNGSMNANANTNAGMNANANTNAGTMPDTTGGSMDMRIAGNAIIIAEQKPGSELKAELIENDQGGFVVVHEGSHMGAVLGTSAYLPAGANMNITIPLNRATVDGEDLHVVVHVDDGDKTFGASDSVMLKDGTGNDMFATVHISKDASDDPLLPRI